MELREIRNEASKHEGAEKPKKPDIPKNYEEPDGINVSLKNHLVTIQLNNGRVETGTLTRVGRYFLEITFATGKSLIVNKAAVITLTVMH